MLRAADAKLAREDPDVRRRIHLQQADVRNSDLCERFGLVHFPSFSFDHLITRRDQESTLRCVARHLALSGVFAFDLAHMPKLEGSSGWFVERKPLGDRRTVLRLGFHRTSPERRLMSIDLWYELYENGLMLERYHEEGEVYVHDPCSIKRLLEESGYQMLERYGGHNREPFTDGSKVMDIVARPSPEFLQGVWCSVRF